MRVITDDAGRLVLPAEIREQLRLVPGSELEASVDDNHLIAEPVKPGVVLIEEDGRLVAATSLPTPRMSQEELLHLIDEVRAWPHRS